MVKNVVLISFTMILGVMAGCSSYVVATMPVDSTNPGKEKIDHLTIKKRMVAKVYLHSGEIHEGEIIQVSPKQITLGRASNFGLEKTVIQAGQIQLIEVESSSKTGRILTSTVGVIGLSLSAIIVFFMVAGDVSGTG